MDEVIISINGVKHKLIDLPNNIQNKETCENCSLKTVCSFKYDDGEALCLTLGGTIFSAFKQI